MPLPTDLAILAEAYYIKQGETSRVVANRLQQAWTTLTTSDPRGWWEANGSDVVATVQGGQRVSAARASAYVPMAADVQDAGEAAAAVVPDAFVADSVAVGERMQLAVVAVSDLLAAGTAPPQAMRSGLARLLMLATTLVADAGKNATHAGIVANPHLGGYYRKLRLPSCDRCAVMAGRHYRWNDGFLRHPACDCVHTPATKAFGGGFDPRDAILSGKVTGLSRADLAAIEDGADVSQVVNAKAKGSLYVADGGLKATMAGTARRAAFGRSGVSGPRLRPEAIYDLAGDDRDLAIRLLRRYGYLT